MVINMLRGHQDIVRSARQLRRVNLAKSAYSIIEVMIGSGLVGILFLALYAAFGHGFRVIQVARESLRATQILEEKMETIRLYTWTEINTAGFIPANFTAPFYTSTNGTGGITYSGKVSIVDAPLTESYKADLKLVTVNVNWQSSGILRQRTMETLVSQYGIQNYKYY